MSMFCFESLLVFLKVCLMPFVHDVSKCCSRIFDAWSKFALKLFPKVDKIAPSVPWGNPKSVQTGTAQRLRQTGRAKSALPRESTKQLALKCEPISESLAIFFDVFPYHLLDAILMDLQIVLEPILTVILWFVWWIEFFEYPFESN